MYWDITIKFHNDKNADAMMGRHLGRFVKNVKSSFAFDGVRERLSHFLDPYHGFGNKCIQVHHHHRHHQMQSGNEKLDIIDNTSINLNVRMSCKAFWIL